MKKIISISIATMLLLFMFSMVATATAQPDYSGYQNESHQNEQNDNEENDNNEDQTKTEPADPDWIFWGVSGAIIIGICFAGFTFVASGRTKKSKNEDGELDQQ